MSWFSDLFSRAKAATHLAVINATSTQVHVLASNFADAADLRGYNAAIARGLSPVQAFKFGDNCVGFWGDKTSGGTPMCALPPEDIAAKWGSEIAGKHKLVEVTIGTKTVRCVLADVMPHKRHIKNGCGIDLNPGAVAAFGLRTPLRTPAVWDWA
jgi:hypothetical protein